MTLLRHTRRSPNPVPKTQRVPKTERGIAAQCTPERTRIPRLVLTDYCVVAFPETKKNRENIPKSTCRAERVKRALLATHY